MTFVVPARLEVDSGNSEQELERAAAATRDVGNAAKEASASTGQMAAATDSGAAAQGRAAVAARGNAAGQDAATAATQRNAAAVRLQRSAYQQLGFQVQDVFQQFALGVNPLVILAQQGGQVTSAFALMGQAQEGAQSKFFRFMTFLSGPYGAALFGAVTILGFLVSSLFEAEEAAEAATAGADGLADAQSALGQVFDLTSGKIKSQNELLVANARLTAINQRAEAVRQRQNFAETLAGVGDGRFGQNLSSAGLLDAVLRGASNVPRQGESEAVAQQREVQRILRGVKSGDLQAGPALQAAEKADLSQLSVTREQLLQAIIDSVSADAKEETARLIDQSLDSGQLAGPLQRPNKPDRPKKDNTADELKKLADFGESAAEKIQRINERFSEQPKLATQGAQAVRHLDELIAELAERKPPDFEKTIQSAKDAQVAVEAFVASELQRPYDELEESNRRQLDQLALIAQGREIEAEALSRINALDDRGLTLNEDQRKAILDQVAAEDLLAQAIDRRNERAAAYLGSFEEVRSAFADFVSLESSGGDFVESLQRGFNRLRGELFTQKIFGPIEQELRDIISGRDGLRTQIDELARDHKTVGDASVRLAGTFDDAAAIVANALRRIEDPNAVIAGPADPPLLDQDGTTIIVSGQNPIKDPDAQEVFERIIDRMVGGIGVELDQIFGVGFFSQMRGAFAGALSGYAQAGEVGAVIGVARSIEGLPKGISDALGVAAGGAQTGFLTGSLLDAIGIKSSKTGGALGGAIGSLIPIPGGDLIGSIAGSLLGGLFGGTKRGSATITGLGTATTRGNSSSREQASLGLAGSVQEGLRRLADALEAEIGSFAVSIGVRDDKFRVDPSGRGITKTSNGAIDFGQDESAAIGFALRDAIGDGAIIGVSDAIRQALTSSPDIDAALEEALKVRDIEDLLSDAGDAFARELRDFERQAQERVRIARQYGFDVLEIERINAEERAALVEDVLQSRVGALQDLLDDLAFGDLAEGTVVERRTRLQAEIAQVQADAEAGVEGAADQLASLQRRLIDLSRDAFGTAGGEYAADRDAAIASAERVIEIENERIRAAQEAAAETNRQLATNNELTSETNDILAEIAASLNRAPAGGAGGATGASGFIRDVVTRTVQL